MNKRKYKYGSVVCLSGERARPYRSQTNTRI